MYLAKQNYAKAQFCYEELLSIQPYNYLVNLKYAEILYTLGNGGNNEFFYMARKYFSHSLILREEGDQSRALWGLL
jgi:hypothetical protein